MTSRTVGIIGGMGPEATVDLMLRVIKATPAQDDADHIRMIVDNDPKIPSRINALLEGTGESPGPYLAEMGRRLESWGADFLAMPCNTAHYYHGEIQASVGIPVLHMIDLAAASVAGRGSGSERVGVLAATAVVRTGLYTSAFARTSLSALYPVPAEQERVQQVIRIVKTGQYGRREIDVLRSAAQGLITTGAQALVIACTELSVIGDGLVADVPVCDASQVLAEAIVCEAGIRPA